MRGPEKRGVGTGGESRGGGSCGLQVYWSHECTATDQVMEAQVMEGGAHQRSAPWLQSLLCLHCLEERSRPSGVHSEEHDQDGGGVYTLP